jgi:hypothetical protein
MLTIPESITKNKVIAALAVLLIVATSAAVYFYIQYTNLSVNPQQASLQQTNDLVAKVGALMVLPTGEVPTVATVKDPESLKSQAFFANAVAGDKVLIYNAAKEAILYDPATNKIVEVAPISTGSSGPPSVATGTTGKK